MTALAGRRRTGLLIPLSSAPSTASWGIGDIGDVAPLSGWLAGAGCRVLQVLPLNEMAPGQQSPYSALSAMAIDPLFIRLADVEEVRAAGGEAAMTCAARQVLECVRRSRRVDYAAVRTRGLDEPAGGARGPLVALVAARLGRTRLIDNLEFDAG